MIRGVDGMGGTLPTVGIPPTATHLIVILPLTVTLTNTPTTQPVVLILMIDGQTAIEGVVTTITTVTRTDDPTASTTPHDTRMEILTATLIVLRGAIPGVALPGIRGIPETPGGQEMGTKKTTVSMGI
jgi:hypothetical protein